MSEKTVKKTKAVKKTGAGTPKTATKTAKATPKAKIAEVAPKGKTVKAAPKAKITKTAPKAKAVSKKAKATEPLSEVVLKAVKFLDDKKAENIAVLDLRPLANLYDYFVIATAANAPHLKSLGDGLQRLYKNEQYEGFRAAGTGDSGWVIVDYDGVMVHVFSYEMRNLYDLEQLWKDAPRVSVEL